MLGLINSNMSLLNLLHTKNYEKARIFVNKLILTPFSPFDIKCKILNHKNLLDHGGRGYPLIAFKSFVNFYKFSVDSIFSNMFYGNKQKPRNARNQQKAF